MQPRTATENYSSTRRPSNVRWNVLKWLLWRRPSRVPTRRVPFFISSRPADRPLVGRSATYDRFRSRRGRLTANSSSSSSNSIGRELTLCEIYSLVVLVVKYGAMRFREETLTGTTCSFHLFSFYTPPGAPGDRLRDHPPNRDKMNVHCKPVQPNAHVRLRQIGQ